VVPTVDIKLNAVVKDRIRNSVYYKSISLLNTFQEVMDELAQEADHAEMFARGSSSDPSTMFCCLFRFFAFKLTEQQLSTLLEHPTSPYARAAGLLYVRIAVEPKLVWKWTEGYLLDDEEFSHTADPKARRMSVGEFAEMLLTDTKYCGQVLPRLPVPVERKIGEALIFYPQFRKRTAVNRDVIDMFKRQGQRIEACTNTNGDWVEGTIVRLDQDAPSRPKVQVTLEDGSSERVDLGKVIVVDRRARQDRRDRRAGGRSRSRGRGAGAGGAGGGREDDEVDLSRHRGSDDAKKLLEELRAKRMDSAVVTAGKTYGRAPIGVRAAMSLQREGTVGSNALKLQEEETMILARARKRQNEEYGVGVSAPAPASSQDEDPSRRAAVLQKYGAGGAQSKYGTSLSGAAKTGNDVMGPDVVRFG